MFIWNNFFLHQEIVLFKCIRKQDVLTYTGNRIRQLAVCLMIDFVRASLLVTWTGNSLFTLQRIVCARRAFVGVIGQISFNYFVLLVKNNTIAITFSFVFQSLLHSSSHTSQRNNLPYKKQYYSQHNHKKFIKSYLKVNARITAHFRSMIILIWK